MSYVYDQRKRPQGPQSTEPERTAAPGPSMDALMTGTARPAAARKGQSFDLDAAMKAKMENAFGGLSAVRDYTPPAQTQAPLQTGPYTGPVTHALSDASPSPSAAGPMQAMRGGGRKKAAPEKKAAPKPKNTKAPVMASYLDKVDMRDYDEETKRISVYDDYDDEESELREDEQGILLSPEFLREYQSRNNKKVKELSRIAAGMLADDDIAGQTREKIQSKQYQKFYAEELKKGNKHAHDDATDMAIDYYNAHKPKIKKTSAKRMTTGTGKPWIMLPGI